MVKETMGKTMNMKVHFTWEYEPRIWFYFEDGTPLGVKELIMRIKGRLKNENNRIPERKVG